jgi:hypothetical protein
MVAAGAQLSLILDVGPRKTGTRRLGNENEKNKEKNGH